MQAVVLKKWSPVVLPSTYAFPRSLLEMAFPGKVPGFTELVLADPADRRRESHLTC